MRNLFYVSNLLQYIVIIRMLKMLKYILYFLYSDLDKIIDQLVVLIVSRFLSDMRINLQDLLYSSICIVGVWCISRGIGVDIM